MNLTVVAYLTSYALSMLGNAIAAIALPVIVLQTTGSALGAGAVAAATAVPAVLAGVFMGVVIDRVDRRSASIVTDLVSAAAVASLPLVDLATDLSIGWFVVAGVVGSLGDVPGLTAREALLPAIVRAGGVSAERLVGLRESIGALAIVVGPAVAGTLVGLLDGSTVLWVTSGISLLAATVTLAMPRTVGAHVEQPRRPAVGGAVADLREGWSTLARDPFLLVATGVGFVGAVVLTALQGLVLPVWFVQMGREGSLGLTLTTLAAGTLVGALAYAALGRPTTRARWLVSGLVGSTAGIATVATLQSVPIVLAGAALTGTGFGAVSSLLGVVTLERLAESVRGRVLGLQNALVTLAPALGIVPVALVTESAGLGPAAALAAGTWVVAVVAALLLRPHRWLTAPAAVPSDRATPGHTAETSA